MGREEARFCDMSYVDSHQFEKSLIYLLDIINPVLFSGRGWRGFIVCLKCKSMQLQSVLPSFTKLGSVQKASEYDFLETKTPQAERRLWLL